MANYRKTPNAQRIPVNIVGSSTFSHYPKMNSEETWNMFISDDWLVNFAGYKKSIRFFEDGTGQGRGIFHSVRGNFLIVVVNNTVFQIGSNLAVTTIGTIESSQGEVFIDENLSNQICIVDGKKAYIYNYAVGGGLIAQTAGALGTGALIPGYVVYHNTFFLFGNAKATGSGANWYAYAVDGNTTIQQISELALQTKPDYPVAVRRLPSQGNNVIVFGNSVCEIWTQVGGLQNYRRNSTINIDYGCISTSTIDASDNYVAWLAVNESNAPVIMVYSESGLKRISTDGIDIELEQLKRPDLSTALFYRQDGHLFYQLTFYSPLDNKTFVYDFNSEKFYQLSDENLNYHPARDMVYFNQTWYFPSLNNAFLYEASTEITYIDQNFNTTDTTLIYDIPRIRVCNSVKAEDSSPFIANSFVFTIEQGNDPYYTGTPTIDLLVTESTFTPPDDEIITETGSGSQAIATEGSVIGIYYQPRIDCAVSRDGAQTYSSYVSRGLNAQGHRRNILNWENMGAANDLTIKLRFWGLSRFVVNQGFLDIY